MINLHRVSKFYRTVVGVNEFTLDLGAGAHGILGPNGSGKTTLINLITGQLKPDIGHIQVFGQTPWGSDRLFARLGLVLSEEVRYNDISALEWVEYLVKFHGFSGGDARRVAMDALERVGLSHAMHRPMGSYSKGMRQRAKLAQAIAHDPDLLILDEPFNGLDPVARHDMTVLLREWAETKSVIIASHILHEVEVISQSFVLIVNSRLLAVGSAKEVQEQLVDTPMSYTFVCDEPQRLSKLLINEELVDSLQIIGADKVRVSSHRVRDLLRELPRWVLEEGLQVREMHSPQDSLQSVFGSLLKIHRGEH
jgi:ABC-2 type transport system ATP-binding protein